ncbi:response regulator [Thermodesulfomicrobium sp. WS]|jgi:two-component system chemotaxis response regulator CheY|uniref:response regulator n=1 Tax=Thermodesulfomicrobium sp. WS TaxID=3004129 RepID=UPI00249336D6|nr:response regulator [Thermodesulfomicrobium sp. WS]BDV01063.1 response regulator [Thermodesulfomicrobium sp. WS]
MKRILTVDDSSSVRQMVRLTLEDAGFEVVEAVDGKDALGKLNPAPDLVITDLNMPNLDGIGLIRALRAEAATRFTPILMLTTESQEAKKQEGKAAGATGWIVKPFKPDQLVAVVRKVLR